MLCCVVLCCVVLCRVVLCLPLGLRAGLFSKGTLVPVSSVEEDAPVELAAPLLLLVALAPLLLAVVPLLLAEVVLVEVAPLIRACFLACIASRRVVRARLVAAWATARSLSATIVRSPRHDGR